MNAEKAHKLASRPENENAAVVEYSISSMTEHDLLEVVEIEQVSALSPWGWDAYYKELRSGDAAAMLVARLTHGVGKEIAGFIVARIIADEVHVNNVAVRLEFRRLGIAAHLLGAVLDAGRGAGSRLAFLEVRAGNDAAQRLYRSCGFESKGRRKRYYRDPVEDAVLMSMLLKSSP